MLLFPNVLSELLTLSWRRSLSYRNQSINFLCKLVDWFLYDRDPHSWKSYDGDGRIQSVLGLLVLKVLFHFFLILSCDNYQKKSSLNKTWKKRPWKTVCSDGFLKPSKIVILSAFRGIIVVWIHFNIRRGLWISVFRNIKFAFVMFSAIWYHLYNCEKYPLGNDTFTACSFTKSNTSPWVFSMFFKLYKWYQILQSVSFTSE